jgi:integrase
VAERDRALLPRPHRQPWVDFRNAWDLTLLAAKIEKRPGLSIYCLRHTFATHLLEGGGAVTDLRAQLGHSDLTTTARYADLVSERRKATVLAMDFTPPKKKRKKKRAAKKQPVAPKVQPDGVSEPAGVYRVERPARRLAAAS